MVAEKVTSGYGIKDSEWQTFTVLANLHLIQAAPLTFRMQYQYTSGLKQIFQGQYFRCINASDQS